MRTYEIMLVCNTEEKSLDEIKNFMKEFFLGNNFNVLEEKDMGYRDLAYPIQKKKKGHYYWYLFETNQEALTKLDRALKLFKAILRFIIIKQEK